MSSYTVINNFNTKIRSSLQILKKRSISSTTTKKKSRNHNTKIEIGCHLSASRSHSLPTALLSTKLSTPHCRNTFRCCAEHITQAHNAHSLSHTPTRVAEAHFSALLLQSQHKSFGSVRSLLFQCVCNQLIHSHESDSITFSSGRRGKKESCFRFDSGFFDHQPFSSNGF